MMGRPQAGRLCHFRRLPRVLLLLTRTRSSRLRVSRPAGPLGVPICEALVVVSLGPFSASPRYHAVKLAHTAALHALTTAAEAVAPPGGAMSSVAGAAVSSALAETTTQAAARAWTAALAQTAHSSAAQCAAARGMQVWCESHLSASAAQAASASSPPHAVGAVSDGASQAGAALLAAGAVPVLLSVVQGSHLEATVLAALRCLEALVEGGPSCLAALHDADALVLLRRQWRNWWASPERGACATLCARLWASEEELAASPTGAPPADAAAAAAAVAPLCLAAQHCDADEAALPLAQLRRWACCGSVLRQRLVSAGAVPALAALLTWPACAEVAADALAELCAQPGLEELDAAPRDFDDAAAARQALAAGALPAAAAWLQPGACTATPLVAEVSCGLLYDLLRAGGGQAVRDLRARGGLKTLVALACGDAGPGAAAVAANVACWLGRAPFAAEEQWDRDENDVTVADAWAAAGGVDALLALVEGAGLNDHAAHAAAVALGHFVSGGTPISPDAVAMLPQERAAAALMPLLRGAAGVGAIRHAASMARHLVQSPPHRLALIAAGVPAATVAAAAAALREPLFPPRAGAGGAGGDGARIFGHQLQPVLSLLHSFACPRVSEDGPIPELVREVKRHTRASLIRTPGAIAGVALILADGNPRLHRTARPHVLARGLELLRAVCTEDPEALLLDEHFAIGAVLVLEAAATGRRRNVLGVDCTSPAALMSLAHPPPGREVAAAVSLSHLCKWYFNLRSDEGKEKWTTCRQVLVGGGRLEMLLAALLQACVAAEGVPLALPPDKGGLSQGDRDPLIAWQCAALASAVGNAATGTVLAPFNFVTAGSESEEDDPEPPRKRRRSGGDDMPSGAAAAKDDSGAAAPAVFVVAGTQVQADATVLARSSRLVARMLAEAPPGPAAPIFIPPLAGVPDAMLLPLFSFAIAYVSDPWAGPKQGWGVLQNHELLPLWILASFLESDRLQTLAVNAMVARRILEDSAVLQLAWAEATHRPEAEGLQAACAQQALRQLARDDPNAPRLLARMQAVADSPDSLRLHMAQGLRDALQSVTLVLLPDEPEFPGAFWA